MCSHLEVSHSLFVKGKIFWDDGTFAWVVWAGLAGVGENLRSLELELLVKRKRTEA